jgi:hypothetical protein
MAFLDSIMGGGQFILSIRGPIAGVNLGDVPGAHRPPSATPHSGGLSPALLAAPAGATRSERPLCGGDFQKANSRFWPISLKNN